MSAYRPNPALSMIPTSLAFKKWPSTQTEGGRTGVTGALVATPATAEPRLELEHVNFQT